MYKRQNKHRKYLLYRSIQISTELKSQYDDIDEQYSIASEKIMESVDKFTRDGSGWVENGVETLELDLSLIHI